MNLTSITSGWRCFEDIPAGPEAASLAASCVFSLATLEISSYPESAGFALTERKESAVWRWAVIGECGCLVGEGFEATQEDAKRAALGVLQRGHLSADSALAI